MPQEKQNGRTRNRPTGMAWRRAFMAIFEKTFCGDFDEILTKVEKAVLNKSISARLRYAADYLTEPGRCSVRLYERYSITSAHGVGMNVTLFQAGEEIQLCAVTNGSDYLIETNESTWGEKAFLETLVDAL